MLYQIISLLLDVATGLVGGAALLRLYMQFQRIPMSARSGNPLGHFVFALTDWAVLPLRRVLPAVGALDTASLVTAFLMELAQFLALWLLAGSHSPLAAVGVLALFGLARLAISLATGLLIVSVVLSWAQSHSPLADLIERLVVPALAPIRRLLPPLGGLDMSPLALLLALQIAAIVLAGVQASVLQAL